MKETTVKINSKYVNRMKSGNPIILKECDHQCERPTYGRDDSEGSRDPRSIYR